MSRSRQKIQRSNQNIINLELQKTIKGFFAEINQSKYKFDEYINELNNRICVIVNNRLNKFVLLHQEIISEKTEQIRSLEESTEKFKLSNINQNMEKLQKIIKSYQEQFERLINIKDFFKKQSQKFKIQLDIKTKEMDTAKKRQKELIKKIWRLQQDIKDIYSSDKIQYKQKTNKEASRVIKSKETYRQSKSVSRFIKVKKRQKNITKTQPNEEMVQRTQMQKKIQDKFLHPYTFYGSTDSKRKMSMTGYEHKKATTSNYSSFKQKKNPALRIPTQMVITEFNLYQDLRHSLRKIHRTQRDQPTNMTIADRFINSQDFQLISLNGLTLMTQIQHIFIEKHGQLKQIDRQSIQILRNLFLNENSVKILEIVLFGHSIKAIQQIRTHRQQFATRNNYQKPEQGPKNVEQAEVFSSQREIYKDSEMKKGMKSNLRKHRKQLRMSKRFNQ